MVRRADEAVTNTDDFIWRMVKGCIQLGLIPDINNTVNLCPVDHVALLASLSSISPYGSVVASSGSASPSPAFGVAQVTGHPRLRFNDLLSSLRAFGYAVEQVEYLQWRTRLEQHVLETQDNALFPLLHFVLDDLPTSTKAAELDDRAAAALARSVGAREGAGVGDEELGRYLAWLVRAGFLPTPQKEGERRLPVLQGGVETAIGRTTAGVA